MCARDYARGLRGGARGCGKTARHRLVWQSAHTCVQKGWWGVDLAFWPPVATNGSTRGLGSGGALGMNSHTLAVTMIALHADVRDLGRLDVTMVGGKEES